MQSRSTLVVALLTLLACGRSPEAGHRVPAQSVGPATLAGCVTDRSPGDHVYSCGGLRVDVRVPVSCPPSGCGLILLVHGDTGTGLLEDAHVRMRDIGGKAGYLVAAPTGPPFGARMPGSTWSTENDATVVAIVRSVIDTFEVDRRRVHVTGFSRGGFVTWRLLCGHSDLFASAAPAAAGSGRGQGETTCFSDGRNPDRNVPVLFLMGRTDLAVDYRTMVSIRDAVIARYNATGPILIAGDAHYRHERWAGRDGGVIETFDHAYETSREGPWADERGHCVPGSLFSPTAPRYAVPCTPPNAFVWGEEVLRFFQAHAMTLAMDK
jgi:polyhydroxybutyrate depolymerase